MQAGVGCRCLELIERSWYFELVHCDKIFSSRTRRYFGHNIHNTYICQVEKQVYGDRDIRNPDTTGTGLILIHVWFAWTWHVVLILKYTFGIDCVIAMTSELCRTRLCCLVVMMCVGLRLRPCVLLRTYILTRSLVCIPGAPQDCGQWKVCLATATDSCNLDIARNGRITNIPN